MSKITLWQAASIVSEKKGRDLEEAFLEIIKAAKSGEFAVQDKPVTLKDYSTGKDSITALITNSIKGNSEWKMAIVDKNVFLQWAGVELEPEIKVKQLHSKREDTLLIMIAALCRKLNFDWNERGASTRMMGFVDATGAKITDDTIRDVFKKIDEVMERKTE